MEAAIPSLGVPSNKTTKNSIAFIKYRSASVWKKNTNRVLFTIAKLNTGKQFVDRLDDLQALWRRVIISLDDKTKGKTRRRVLFFFLPRGKTWMLRNSSRVVTCRESDLIDRLLINQSIGNTQQTTNEDGDERSCEPTVPLAGRS